MKHYMEPQKNDISTVCNVHILCNKAVYAMQPPSNMSLIESSFHTAVARNHLLCAHQLSISFFSDEKAYSPNAEKADTLRMDSPKSVLSSNSRISIA